MVGCAKGILKDICGSLVNTIRLFVNWCPLELSSYPPTQLGNRGHICPDGYILKNWIPGLRKTFLS